jgi:hypothetical protein
VALLRGYRIFIKNMNFKEFQKTGYCEGLRVIAMTASVAMQRNPTLDTLQAAKYTMDKYFEVYYQEIELWIRKETNQ